jgi:predicted ATPase/class 3 adenylate cyclase
LASDPPAGVVTMLFTDIEGSTKLAQVLGPHWPAVLTEHRRIVRDAIADAGGYLEGTEGDSFFATFADPGAALAAATTAQRELRAFGWPDTVGDLRVRMGLHTGAVEHTDGHYVGLEVHRGARVGAVANGGQVIVTDAARAVLPGAELEDLGWHRLKDFPDPMRLFHLVVDPDRRADAFPPPRTLDVRPTNLPPTDRPPIGRTKELAAVTSAFTEDGARLVTLIGLGGVGKTTIAFAAARVLLDAFTDGVWMVRAEALRSSHELLQSVAAAMYVRDTPGSDLLDAIAARVEDRRHLLVLDNLEHLADAPAMVARILACAPGIAVLATSRAALRLESEQAITIGPMATDEALRMFMARAKAVDPSLTLADHETRAAVEQLCAKLGALPLALELAAARLRLMTPRQLLERLGSALELRSAEPDRPGRQRSMRATIEWTLDLLTPDAQTLFTRLGVFLGIPTLDVIEMVCGGGIDVLEAAAVLVDYSLLQKNGSGLALVEALREVASERLAAAPDLAELRARHAAAMIVIGRGVRSPGAAPHHVLDAVERLLPDTWAAARWASEHEPLMQAALASNLGSFWAMKGSLRATLEQIDAALSVEELGEVARGELLLNKGHVLLLAAHGPEALEAVGEGMALLGDRSDLDRGGDLHSLAQAQSVAGRLDEAVASARGSLEHHRRAGSKERVILSLIMLAQVLMQSGRWEEAGPLLDEAELLAEELDTMGAVGLPNIRADWSLFAGEPVRALEGYARSLEGTMGSFGLLAFYDVAGVVIALERLGEHEAALEVGAAVVEAAADWGTTPDTFNYIEGGVPGAMERATAALGVERASAAATRGRGISPGARPGHALAVARGVLDKLGVG